MRRVVVIGIVIAVVMAGGLAGVLALWPSPTQAAPPGRARAPAVVLGRCPTGALPPPAEAWVPQLIGFLVYVPR